MLLSLSICGLVFVAHPPVPIPPPVAVEITGKVREVGGGMGTKSDAILELEDKSEVVLHGRDDLDDVELHHLANTRIKVNGMKGDPLLPRGNHVRVIRYEILDAGGGVVPKIGKLAEITIEGRSRLLFVDEDGKALFLPQGFSAKLMKHVGAKVWVVAPDPGGKNEIAPSRFAILRPGPKNGGESVAE